MTGTTRALVALVALAGCAKGELPEPLVPDAPVVAEEVEPAPEHLEARTASYEPPAGEVPVAAGYLEAHAGLEQPRQRFGGPVQVELSQSAGGVYVFRPDRGATGRAAAFSDRFFTMYDARLQATLVDATAVDALTTEDRVELTASWKDGAGNVYEVRCCTELVTRGAGHPTFGGVVTNHVLHGFTGIGTRELPATFAYAAMWGAGDVLKNGEVLDSGVPVHLMLTEDVRDVDLATVDDGAVVPTRQQLEMLVAPRHAPDGQVLPVRTGYTVRGEELPFWHVVFPHYQVQVTEPQT